MDLPWFYSSFGQPQPTPTSVPLPQLESPLHRYNPQPFTPPPPPYFQYLPSDCSISYIHQAPQQEEPWSPVSPPLPLPLQPANAATRKASHPHPPQPSARYSHPLGPHMTVGHLLHKVPEYPLPRVSGAHSLSFKAHTAKTMPFISKLRALLSEAENADCIAWDRDGESFIISSTSPRLLSDVLPKTFCHSNLASLTRQLNVYGFRRLGQQDLLDKLELPDTAQVAKSFSIWHHPLFTRDGEDWITMTPRPSRARLAEKMERLLSAGGGRMASMA